MACDKPTGDCTNVSPCGAGCAGCGGCESNSSFCPTIAITGGGYGYNPADAARDPDATVSLETCNETVPFALIYKKPKPGAFKAVFNCDGDVLGFAADGPYCLGTNVPPLPKCQDVALTPGTFTNATITVNTAGCISAVAKGEPELYTPDECCGGSSTGSGTTGGRGPKGDPGAAATIAVIPEVTVGTGTVWSVENTGTPSAAIFKFTSPAPVTPGTTPTGATGQVCDFKVANGLVTQMPGALVTSVNAQASGTQASLILLGAAPNASNPCRIDVTLNLDALHNDLTAYIDEDIAILQAQINGGPSGGVGVNGNLAWNGTSAAVSLKVFKEDNTEVATVAVNPNGSATLPTGVGSSPLYVFLDGIMVGVYPG